tara:strand:+ start:3220 stop:4386 length:1167 start_codon:yes stop_codon:yes gene_type:complete
LDRISRFKLVEETKKIFKSRFSVDPAHTSSAPGRINIIGEHTDYNLGLAMPVGINRWVCASISHRVDSQIHVFSKNFNKSLQLDLIGNIETTDLWEKYIVGILSVVKQRFNIKFGFNMLLYGNVPIGAGVSSSAALEVAILGSIKELYQLSITTNEFLDICSKVDNDYVGVKSGMLDQYVSLLSDKQGPMLIDFSKSSHKNLKFSLKKENFILINSLVDRKLARSDYNVRVKECREALELINSKLDQSKKIYEIDCEDLNYLDRHSIHYKRLYHVVTENQRVYKLLSAIKEGNINMVGKILSYSHKSLSENYEVSCNEIESIIKVSNYAPGFYGGRIMGGGFGGCTVNLVDSDRLEEFESYVHYHLCSKYSLNVKIERVEFSDGLKSH